MMVLKMALLLMVAAAALTDARLDIFKRQYMLITNSKEKPASIPYKECIQSCENCACTLIYPPELATCICLRSTTAADKPAIQKYEQATEKPVAIPYKECIESCGTCACTLDFPIELSDCICQILQNLSNSSSAEMSHKKYIPYSECIQSCKNCACTMIWPPQLSQCVCLGNNKPLQIIDR
ncbi:hypothetical protein ACE6H2_015416 [Prunus campanulata]